MFDILHFHKLQNIIVSRLCFRMGILQDLVLATSEVETKGSAVYPLS